MHTFRLWKQLHPFLNREALLTITHVTSYLDYCNVLYLGLPLKSIWKLQLVQNAAAQVVNGVGYSHAELGHSEWNEAPETSCSRGLKAVPVRKQPL